MTQARLGYQTPTRLRVGTPFGVTLRQANAVPLRGPARLRLDARQRLLLVGIGTAHAAGGAPYEIENLGYFYELLTPDHQAILTFHWTPNTTDPKTVTFPHVHLGPAIVAGQTTIRPRDLHKAHIPTGVVSLAAVVRLAITEFGVVPLRTDWERVLRAAEEAGDGR